MFRLNVISIDSIGDAKQTKRINSFCVHSGSDDGDDHGFGVANSRRTTFFVAYFFCTVVRVLKSLVRSIELFVITQFM